MYWLQKYEITQLLEVLLVPLEPGDGGGHLGHGGFLLHIQEVSDLKIVIKYETRVLFG